MTSVADELALDRYLDTLDPMDRASIERAMKSRYHNAGAVDAAYHDGFADGREHERALARKAAEQAAAANNQQTPPQSA